MIEQIQIRDLTELQTLQGVSSGDSGLGTFTGSIISNNTTLKNALQELETEIETPTLLTLEDITDVTYQGALSNGDFLMWDIDHWEERTPFGSDINLVTTAFNNNLSAADDTVQKALETLDSLSASSTAVGVATNTTNFSGILSAADTNVQLALDTIDDIDYADGTAYANHVADSTIHYTQASISIPASQVSDFDAEVSNNVSVTANTAHVTADGKSHSDVVLNNTHRTSDGKNHSDVVLNNTHRTSTGGDHTYINQNVTTTASPTFVNATLSGKTAGSIPFFGAGGVVSEDNSNLFWDNSAKVLQVTGSANPSIKVIGTSSSGFPLVQLKDQGVVSGEDDWNIENGREGDGILGFWRGTTKMAINNEGNVGIGTNSITARVTTKGSTSLSGGIIADWYDSAGVIRTKLLDYGAQEWYMNAGVGELGRITFATPGGRMGMVFFNSTGTGRTQILHSQTGGLAFGASASATAPSDQLTIGTSGNVLINTTTDSGYKFDVNGTARVGDHGTGTDDQLVNVCYGTSATPPTASETTEGALYIQYTA